MSLAVVSVALVLSVAVNLSHFTFYAFLDKSSCTTFYFFRSNEIQILIKKGERISTHTLKYYFIVAATSSKLLVSQFSMEACRHNTMLCVYIRPADVILFTETLI